MSRIRALRVSGGAADLLLVAGITLLAAILRLLWLGDIPFGLHPDEAQLGTDAHKILAEGWIGVYTTAALGQPAGHSYLVTPFVWALGDTEVALRLPIALVALAAVPLLYALVRITLGRLEATLAALLLAVSYWHLLYSRVAHWSITYGTVLLAAWLCFFLAVRSRSYWWFAASGLLLGIGVYTYNVYPIAVVAFGAGVLALTPAHLRDRVERTWWLRSTGITFATALLAALPMIVYVANPDSYYWDHVENYSEVGVVRSDEFKDASLAGKARIVGTQARTFVASYAWNPKKDFVDANGQRPVFDPLTLALLGAGVAIAFRRRREPMVIVALLCVLIIPLPAVLQNGSIMRQPVGAAPYVALLAALPLAWMLRRSSDGGARWVAAGALAVSVVVGGIAAITLRDYFGKWDDSELVRFVYHQEITSASHYIDDLPPGALVQFYSNRHPYALETRQFLARGVDGVDGSHEFGGDGRVPAQLDRSRMNVFVLLPGYLELLPEIRNTYPGGREVVRRRGAFVQFYAYEVPAEDGAQ